MMNRKGKFFFRTGFKYEEIAHPEEGLQELELHGMAEKVNPAMWKDLLSFLSRKDLLILCSHANLTVKKSSAKKELEEMLFSHGFFHSSLLDDIIVQSRLEELSYLLFLYFGRIQENLALYTLRDLGIRKVRAGKKAKARFSSKEEAFSQFYYSRLMTESVVIQPVEDWPLPLNVQTEEMREGLLVSLADEKKKEGFLQEAINILQHAKGHPGREKLVRLLYQAGDELQCESILLNMLDFPASDLEFLFAEDFYARKFGGKKVSSLTETLRNSMKVQIDESYFRQPEAGIIDWFKNEGITAFHVENYLWNALFGLLFWEELFESEKSLLYNEFERIPADLLERTFHEVHKVQIEAKLTLLKDKSEALKHLLMRVSHSKDVENGIFSWHESLPSLMEMFVTYADHGSLSEILLYMCKDFNNRSTGFPDIMALEDGKLKFYEIKAPGDSLKNHQLLQIIALSKAGFSVEVLQVEYTYNPNQLYVVVDLETTGGHLPYHRITEIGAVKVKNGVVLDSFQTLINPERHISLEISALTGITNEMVKDAPKFREVADSFQEFSKDCIFVAHNVNFDYGFLQSEFERIEQKFVRPYVCTKALMKKHYPGLDSYGLKNLCSYFKIPLVNHHRALADAEAAAGLLRLINAKRGESS